jgi:hypothetical protein
MVMLLLSTNNFLKVKYILNFIGAKITFIALGGAARGNLRYKDQIVRLFSKNEYNVKTILRKKNI